MTDRKADDLRADAAATEEKLDARFTEATAKLEAIRKKLSGVARELVQLAFEDFSAGVDPIVTIERSLHAFVAAHQDGERAAIDGFERRIDAHLAKKEASKTNAEAAALFMAFASGERYSAFRRAASGPFDASDVVQAIRLIAKEFGSVFDEELTGAGLTLHVAFDTSHVGFFAFIVALRSRLEAATRSDVRLPMSRLNAAWSHNSGINRLDITFFLPADGVAIDTEGHIQFATKGSP